MSDSPQENVSLPALVVTGGLLDGTTFVVETGGQEFLLGSSSDCHFQVLLGNVEPVHAKLVASHRRLLLSDAMSATGTYVNGEKISEGHALQDGDRVCLGPPGSKESCKLLVRLPAGDTFGAGEGLAMSEEGEAVVLDTDSEPLVLMKPGEVETGLAPVGPPTGIGPKLPPPPPPPAPAPPTVLLTAPPPPPPPPPPSAAPPKAAPPPPPPPPPPEPRKPSRPDYTTEPPSIGDDRPREPVRLPSAVTPVPAPKRVAVKIPGARPVVSRAAILGLVAALVAGGGYFAARRLLRKPPALLSVAPARTEPGQTVTLSGRDFDSEPGGNVVRFGEQAGEVIAASPTQLAVKVPASAGAGGPGDLRILVETSAGKSGTLALKVYRAPRVSGLEPEVAMPGNEVVLKGQNLDGKPLTVVMGGLPAEVKEAALESLRVVVPADLPVTEGRAVPVSVQVGGDSAKPAQLILGRLPLLTEISPRQGAAGDRVVIKGRGFDPDPTADVVTFGGQPALVLTASPDGITVAAPAAVNPDVQSEAEVRVKVKGALSTSSLMFVLTRVSSAMFIPRFYAAAVTEYPGQDMAFVSTELGPLLLLAGKSEAPSTAERAVRVASALNSVVEVAARTPPHFEFRDKPAPSVAVVGSPAPLLTATPEDAAAYDKPWDPAAKGARRTGPRSVATYWAALLQDYFSLFVLRERPLRVLELSPRGKTLADVYSEALRQAGAGTGVPSRVVLPVTPTLARSLRDMALILPAEGQGRAAAAVEGRWVGTMEEGGVRRQIQVRLKFEGSKLTGTLAARAGAVEMNTPLRDLVYDKGSLRFVVDLSGSPRVFAGGLERETITGDIQRPSGDKTPIGHFSLKYVE